MQLSKIESRAPVSWIARNLLILLSFAIKFVTVAASFLKFSASFGTMFPTFNTLPYLLKICQDCFRRRRKIFSEGGLRAIFLDMYLKLENGYAGDYKARRLRLLALLL